MFKTLPLRHYSEVSKSVDVIYKRAQRSVEAGSDAKYVVVMDGSRNQGNTGADELITRGLGRSPSGVHGQSL